MCYIDARRDLIAYTLGMHRDAGMYGYIPSPNSISSYLQMRSFLESIYTISPLAADSRINRQALASCKRLYRTSLCFPNFSYNMVPSSSSHHIFALSFVLFIAGHFHLYPSLFYQHFSVSILVLSQQPTFLVQQQPLVQPV